VAACASNARIMPTPADAVCRCVTLYAGCVDHHALDDALQRGAVRAPGVHLREGAPGAAANPAVVCVVLFAAADARLRRSRRRAAPRAKSSSWRSPGCRSCPARPSRRRARVPARVPAPARISPRGRPRAAARTQRASPARLWRRPRPPRPPTATPPPLMPPLPHRRRRPLRMPPPRRLRRKLHPLWVTPCCPA
jgi:hypothetical protein